jgi:hypothetical protein
MTPFQKARAEERLNRMLAYLPMAPSLCGLPVVPITPRHRLELEAAGNAFFSNKRPLRGDVLDFLWRLNHCFRRVNGEMPNLRGNTPRPSSLACRLMRWRMRRVVTSRKFDLDAAASEIKGRIAVAYQDQAGSAESGEFRSELKADRFWLDGFEAFYCGNWGWSYDVMLDTPIALLFQLYREHCLMKGIELPFMAPSDALYGKTEL